METVWEKYQLFIFFFRLFQPTLLSIFNPNRARPWLFYPGWFDLLVTVARKCLKIEPGPDFWIPYQFPGKLWDKILFYRSIKTILGENYPKSRSRWGPEKNQPERRCETRFFLVARGYLWS